ncbi:MAG: ferritin family protein [Desulfatiglandaceae bacterium]|jgi:rubrerythrin
MELEESIKTAIVYEKKIRDIYLEGGRKVKDDYGRSFFQAMSADEQRHVDYLEYKLDQWRNTGKIVPERLQTSIPSRKAIQKEVQKITRQMKGEDRGIKQQQLVRALKVEMETSDFYRRMVAELSNEGRDLFARFLEIEESHIEAVQFELDYVSSTGYWFNIKEFDME